MTPSGWPVAPAGFAARTEGASALYVGAVFEGAARSRGLTTERGWTTALSEGSVASGRGATAVIDGVEGTRWRLKCMRRGGMLASLWRDRYPSAGRLVATLEATVEAHARGVPTARPVALFIERGPGPFARGFMALEELDRAEDLARRVLRRALTPAELAAIMAAVRSMHDRGVIHTDLNLGNVMLVRAGEGEPDVAFVDFDRATVVTGQAPFTARQTAIRRLERSCAKLTGSPGAWGPGSEDLWYTLYAGDDRELSDRLEHGRRAGRVALALHQLGWRRNRA